MPSNCVCWTEKKVVLKARLVGLDPGFATCELDELEIVYVLTQPHFFHLKNRDSTTFQSGFGD